MKATLVRLEHNETEILGVLLLDGQLFSYTLELPWRSNTRSISCIPTGHYQCERYDSPRFGNAWGILDVVGRSGIVLGHVGNDHSDTTGCILLGKYPGQITNPGPRAVTNSAQTCAALQARTHDLVEMQLAIINLET